MTYRYTKCGTRSIIIWKCKLKSQYDVTSHLLESKVRDKKHWQGYRKKGTLAHCGWECKSLQLFWKNDMRVAQNISELLSDPAVPFLGTYPK